VGGEQHPAAPGAQAVHAGKQRGVADKNAHQSGSGQQQHRIQVQTAPLAIEQAQRPEQGQGKKQTPAGEGKGPHVAGRFGRKNAAHGPTGGGQQGQRFGAHQLPATFMRLMSTEPTDLAPVVYTSAPMASMPMNMSLRLLAMVISCTGKAISPFSTQKPLAPRE
jgi:hypothetical protein